VSDVLLRVEDLYTHFKIRKPGGFGKDTLRAVDGVSFTVRRGETLGLVGESGCGKTTLGRTILGLHVATRGAVYLDGQNLIGMPPAGRRRLRRQLQVVFQDPYASLDPRLTVHDVIAEPLRINRMYRPQRIPELLEQVGLEPEMARLRPAQFSGGQRQRIGIARALALEPQLLILDEPVSALDVSIQAQVVNLLKRLQRELGLTYLFIAHDLSVVRHISHRVAVMYLGKIVEIGDRDQVFAAPTHPYTKSLLSAVPVPDPVGRAQRRRIVLEGDLPNAVNPPAGCSFHTRCFRAEDVCTVDEPELAERVDSGRLSACHFAEPTAPTSLATALRS
jgi:oligopeptide/dipeptide ABC transporter ATP-binding protein